MARIRSAALGTGLIAMLVLAACGDGTGVDPTPLAFACQTGAWRLASGETLVLTPATGGLRYRLLDGRSGRFEPRDGKSDGAQLQAREGWRESGPMVARVRFEPCAAGRMEFALDGGPSGTAARLPLLREDVRFRSGELTLRGRLVLPVDGNGPFPLAVLVHGSENYSAAEFQSLHTCCPRRAWPCSCTTSAAPVVQRANTRRISMCSPPMRSRRWPRRGRCGRRRFRWPATSAVARVAGSGRWRRRRSKVDYVVALYGLAENALAEDREQVMNDLRAKEHGDEVLAQAREITDATALLMRTGFTQGFDELDAVRAKYGEAPWLADIRGEYTGQVLGLPGWVPRWAARRVAMHYDQGTSWDYEPLPVLAALAAPQLWVIAEDDLEAPNTETLRRLRLLQSKGRPIDLPVIPDTDHGYLHLRRRRRRARDPAPSGRLPALTRGPDQVAAARRRLRHRPVGTAARGKRGNPASRIAQSVKRCRQFGICGRTRQAAWSGDAFGRLPVGQAWHRGITHAAARHQSLADTSESHRMR